MFRASRRADYAVRVMIAVAAADPHTITATSIQQKMVIPRSFLVKVIGDLKRGGLVNTQPGPHGGLRLAHASDVITLRQIVEAVEGPIYLNSCLLQANLCPLDSICPAHNTWGNIQRLLRHEMDAVALSNLVEEGKRTGYVKTSVNRSKG